MPKTNLALEDIEQIKQSKGKLSAAEVQRKYSIGWDRLQKLWNDKPVAQLSPALLEPVKQRGIEHVTNQHKELVVEDLFARLGQLEAKMDKQTTQMERQTDLMQNILDSLDSVSEAESDTQSIEEESHTLQDI